MSFFTNPEVATGAKLLEIIYLMVGLISIYAGVKNAKDQENPHRIGTAIYWILLGVVLAFGRWIPNKVNGVLVLAMCLPPIFKKVGKGYLHTPTKAEMEKNFSKIGMKIFLPALAIGLFALGFGIFTKLGALVGLGVGVLVSAALLMAFHRDNTPKVLLDDSERMLSLVGPISMLPMLLASLGAVFTAAGVGKVISSLVGRVIPEGNVNVGIIVYAVGMVLFTVIMGNAFAAITVMTVGIGAPFVLAYGANPVLIGMLALTCGYCGTLMTPMAANFNIVPVALLEMKNRFSVIKHQWMTAIIMLVFQICYMILFK